jgi:hypothetical protein
LRREVAGYYGTYALDTKRSVITHRVLVSLRAAESGAIERGFMLQGDALVLTARAARDGSPVTYVLTWARLSR